MAASSRTSAAPANDAGQRVLGDVDREARLLRQTPVEAAEQRAAAGEDNPRAHEVGDELRRRDLDRLTDGLDDGVYRAREGVADLDAADLDGLRQAGREVAAPELDRELALERVGGAGLDFDFLGGALADEHVMHLAGVGDDLRVHLVAGGADRRGDDDAAERDDGDLCGAAADVDDHAAAGLHDRQAGANRRGHRLFDEVGVARAGVQRGIVHGALLDLGDAGGDADRHAGPREAKAEALVHRADEVVEHLLGDAEVGDDAVVERADGDDVGRGAADHALGLGADGEDLLVDAVDGDDGGLVDDDAAALDHDKRIGGSQVDADVVREHTQAGR